MCQLEPQARKPLANSVKSEKDPVNKQKIRHEGRYAELRGSEEDQRLEQTFSEPAWNSLKQSEREKARYKMGFKNKQAKLSTPNVLR